MASFNITRKNGDVFTVLVDDDDIERVLAFGAWRVNPVSSGVYVQGRGSVLLHRFVMGNPPRPACVRILDHNPLNAQKSNLVVGTKGDAIRAQRLSKNSSTRERGIAYFSESARYAVRRTCHGVSVYGGTYATLEAAVLARDQLIQRLAAGDVPAPVGRGRHPRKAVA